MAKVGGLDKMILTTEKALIFKHSFPLGINIQQLDPAAIFLLEDGHGQHNQKNV